MNQKFQQVVKALTPYFIIGVITAFFIGLLIIFSYLFLWGLLIGGLLWLIAFIKSFFFPAKMKEETEGRIIEHNDQK